jgi:hypothetical protein
MFLLPQDHAGLLGRLKFLIVHGAGGQGLPVEDILLNLFLKQKYFSYMYVVILPLSPC